MEKRPTVHNMRRALSMESAARPPSGLRSIVCCGVEKKRLLLFSYGGRIISERKGRKQ